MITCNNLNKTLGKFSLKDVSFELPEGYILGMIGRNGCGKTTLIRTIMSLYRLKNTDSGDVSLNGVNLSEDIKCYKSKIAYVLADNPFPEGAKVLEIGEMLGDLYENFKLETYRALVAEYGLDEKKRVGKLSDGQKIRVQLAFAISCDTEVYIFDEPTGKLDVEFRESFYSIVRELAAKGKCIIYASHLVEELENFADYILWMKKENDEASVKYFGTIDELKNSYQMVEVGNEKIDLIPDKYVVGGRKRENHSEYLIKLERAMLKEELRTCARYANLNEIMYYEEKGGMV